MVAVDPFLTSYGNSSSTIRKKVSALEPNSTCMGVYSSDYSYDSCGDSATVSSACGMDSALEMSCRSNGDCSEVQEEASGSGAALCIEKSREGCNNNIMYASGWMYGNQEGKMCGPYTQQQLYEGLSSGFLPEDLLVYPIINGYMPNSVPLKCFKQFPDHVATGFAYLQPGMISVVPTVSNDATVHQRETQREDMTSTVPPQTNTNGSVSDQLVLNEEETNLLASYLSLGGEHACWFLLDNEGTNLGPHSILELYNWRQCGYVSDASQIRDGENKLRPITLASLLDLWKVKCGGAKRDELVSGVSFISEVSEELSCQLQSGIVKIARRSLLDEIISSVISDFLKAKKSEEQLKSDQLTSAAHVAESISAQVTSTEKNAVLTAEATGCKNMVNAGGHSRAESLKFTKSVGSIENFETSCLAVSGILYNHCMQILWNAVFYDTVATYSSSWRKKKLWFRSPDISTVASYCKGSHTNYSDKLDLASNAASFREESSRKVALSRSDGRESIISSISEHVERELFLSLESDLSDYTSVLIKDGSNHAASTVCDANMHEENLSPFHSSFHEQSNLEVAGEKKNDLNVVPARLRFSSDFSDSQRLLQEGESSEQITSEDLIANIFRTTLETPDSPVNDELDTHEPPPPGCESNFNMPSLRSKIRPVRSKESIPEIEDYVALALCRQKLHKDVMRDWKSLFMKSFLNEFLASWKRSHQLSCVETLAPRKVKILARNKKQVHSNILNQKEDKPKKPSVKSSEKSLAKRSKKLPTDSHFLKESRNVDMLIIDSSVRKPSQEKMRNADRQDHCSLTDVTKCHTEKVGKDAQSKLTCDKSQDVEVVDKSDEEFLIARPRRIPKKKKKEFQEGANVAKSCEEITMSAEESGETIDCKNHEESLSNKSSQKMQKVHISKLKRKDMSDVRVQGTKSYNGTVKGSTEISGKEGDREILEKVGPQRLSKRRKKDAANNCQDISNPTGNREKFAEGKKFVEKSLSSASHKSRKSSSASMLKRKRQLDEKIPHVPTSRILSLSSKDTEVAVVKEGDHVGNKEKIPCNTSNKQQKGSKKSKPKRKLLAKDTAELSPTKDLTIDHGSSRAVSLKPLAKQTSKTGKKKVSMSMPMSDGCARTSINGWHWHAWSLKASPEEKTRVRGNSCVHIQHFGSKINSTQNVLSARTNRAKMRNLLAAADGADVMKISQLMARKKRLRFQQSSIHDWGLVALEPIEAEDFVIEYVGELIRSSISEIRERQYEKMGIGSSYLFRLDDGYVVDATKRGGIARFINHSCDPNCYTKIISVDGQKKIFIYAKRHIDVGEEVCYNYKFPLEDDKIPCNCGAQKCRGSLN